MNDKTVVHVVDDDAAMRDSTAFLLDVNGFKPRIYDSAGALLAEIPHRCAKLRGFGYPDAGNERHRTRA